MTRYLTHDLLRRCGVEHGFGTRSSGAPPGLVRPRQVHGAQVVRVEAADAAPGEADAVVCTRPGVRIGVATADCVPILLCDARGAAVGAVHAGWRGLARGVVEAGVDALRQSAEASGELTAAIGPHIGPCCYEIDAPVIEALSARFGGALPGALRPVGGERAMLDLGALCRTALRASGVAGGAVGQIPDACTRCHAERFHSYRRDGAGAGRLVHFVAARSDEA